MDLKLKPSESGELVAQLRMLSKANLPGAVKYAIYKNIEILLDYCKAFIQMRDDMFMEFGVVVDNQYFIPKTVDDKPNPNYERYKNEVVPLDVPALVTDLKPLPLAVFNGEQEFEGDLEMVYKYLIRESA